MDQFENVQNSNLFDFLYIQEENYTNGFIYENKFEAF